MNRLVASAAADVGAFRNQDRPTGPYFPLRRPGTPIGERDKLGEATPDCSALAAGLSSRSPPPAGSQARGRVRVPASSGTGAWPGLESVTRHGVRAAVSYSIWPQRPLAKAGYLAGKDLISGSGLASPRPTPSTGPSRPYEFIDAGTPADPARSLGETSARCCGRSGSGSV